MPTEVTERSQELPNCNNALHHIPPDPAECSQREEGRRGELGHGPDSLRNRRNQVDLFIARGQYVAM